MLEMALRTFPYSSSFNNLEPSPTESLSRLSADTPHLHDMTLSFGSSSSRSVAQARAAKQHTANTLSNIPPHEPIIFSDGSALTNPGPCGAAVVCYTEGMSSQPLILKQSVSRYSTSFHGELVALKLSSDFLKLTCNVHRFHRFQQAHIFSDCKAAILSVSSTKLHSSQQQIIDSIQQDIAAIQNKGIVVNLYWVPGHADLHPNELADKAAKVAANESLDTELPDHITISMMKNSIRRHILSKWDRAWHTVAGGSYIHEHIPNIPRSRYISTHSRSSETKYLRLLSGHTRLNDHMNKLFPDEYNPCCQCSRERQTISHFLIDCPIFSAQRETMTDSIELKFIKDNTPVWERSITLADLLWPQYTNESTRRAVKNAVIIFINDTNTDI